MVEIFSDMCCLIIQFETRLVENVQVEILDDFLLHVLVRFCPWLTKTF